MASSTEATLLLRSKFVYIRNSFLKFCNFSIYVNLRNSFIFICFLFPSINVPALSISSFKAETRNSDNDLKIQQLLPYSRSLHFSLII